MGGEERRNGPVFDNSAETSCLDGSRELAGESEDCGHHANHQTAHEEYESCQPDFQSLEIGLRGQMLELCAKFRFEDGHSLFEGFGGGHEGISRFQLMRKAWGVQEHGMVMPYKSQ